MLRSIVYSFSFYPSYEAPAYTCIIRKYNFLVSVQFFIPGDTGTGSRYRSVITFDMVILKQTKLPAIAHDSVMIVNIDEEKKNALFDLYLSETNKQIFMAYDLSNITDNNTKKVLIETLVLELAQGSSALFGKQWSIK